MIGYAQLHGPEHDHRRLRRPAQATSFRSARSVRASHGNESVCRWLPAGGDVRVLSETPAPPGSMVPGLTSPAQRDRAPRAGQGAVARYCRRSTWRTICSRCAHHSMSVRHRQARCRCARRSSRRSDERRTSTFRRCASPAVRVGRRWVVAAVFRAQRMAVARRTGMPSSSQTATVAAPGRTDSAATAPASATVSRTPAPPPEQARQAQRPETQTATRLVRPLPHRGSLAANQASPTPA
jgi:hypothetical protein